MNPIDFNTGTGYIPKLVHLGGDTTHDRMLSGIKKLSEAVGSTLGPKGRTVLIESQTHIGGITNTKDGVTVAKAISVTDPLENLAINVVKESAQKTAIDAGDGTTTSIVIADGLIENGFDAISKVKGAFNTTRIIRFMSDIFTEEIIPFLDKYTIPCTKSNLLDIAVISANNDQKIGSLIHQAYNKVGVDADSIITVARSDRSETYVETHDGFKLEQGWLSPYFRTSEKKDECVLEDCYIFVSSMEIAHIEDITAILEFGIREKKKILFISPMSEAILNVIVRNVVANPNVNLKWCAIDAPALGWKRDDIMNDLALATGAIHFSSKTGDDLTNLNHLCLGRAKRVLVTPQYTVIQRNESMDNREDVDERVSELKEQLKTTTKKPMAQHLRSRIASLSGSIGQIYVGADTENERKERHDRVDDAVCAVRSALESGVIPGGGVITLALSHYMGDMEVDCEDTDRKMAYGILRKGLLRPFIQIMENAGENPFVIGDKITEYADENFRYGYNLMAYSYGDMIEMGVIDPTKVTKEAIRNAISVASTILNTSVVITQERSMG